MKKAPTEAQILARREYKKKWWDSYKLTHHVDRSKRKRSPTSRKYVQSHSHGDRDPGLPGVAEVRYMPDDWTVREDRSTSGPITTRFPIKLEMIDQHRNYDCGAYDDCLDKVCGPLVGSGHREPGSFTCRSCKYFRTGKEVMKKVKASKKTVELEDLMEEELQEDL